MKIVFFYYWWGGTKCLGTAATSGLLYKPQMIDEDDFWSNWWNKDWQGKPKYSEKTYEDSSSTGPDFTVLDSRIPHPGSPGPRIYIPKEESGPAISPGTGFPFDLLLRLAGLRWKYSTPPPH
jgi:hypothetical protein